MDAASPSSLLMMRLDNCGSLQMYVYVVVCFVGADMAAPDEATGVSEPVVDAVSHLALFFVSAHHPLIILRFLCGLGGVVVSPQAHRLTFHICSASGSGSVSPP